MRKFFLTLCLVMLLALPAVAVDKAIVYDGTLNKIKTSDPLPIANGGTGQATATAASNALLPSQSGNAGKALITNGTLVSFGYPTQISGTLAIANGGTGQTTQQAAVNALTAVSGASESQVLTKIGSNAMWQDAQGGGWSLVDVQTSTATGTVTFTFSSLTATKIYRLIMVGVNISSLYLNSKTAGTVYRMGTDYTSNTNSTSVPLTNAQGILDVIWGRWTPEYSGTHNGVFARGSYGRNSSASFIPKDFYFIFGHTNAENPSGDVDISSIICEFANPYSGVMTAYLYELTQE